MNNPDMLWPGQDKQCQLANCRLRIDNLWIKYQFLADNRTDNRPEIKNVLTEITMYKNICDQLSTELRVAYLKVYTNH